MGKMYGIFGFWVPTLSIALTCVAPKLSLAQQVELTDRAQLNSTLSKYQGHVNFVGHGSKSQFADVSDVAKKLDIVVDELNARHGVGGWIAMFGGDPYSAEKPDIGFAMKYLKDQHGIPLLAVQSDVVKGWGGVDKHIDFVFWVPTTYEPKLDANKQPIIENGQTKTQVVWGGFKDGKAAGPTSVLLATGENRISTEMIALGGGPIAAEEFRFAQEIGLPTRYVRVAAKYPEVNGPYGSIEDMIGSGAAGTRCSKLLGH